MIDLITRFSRRLDLHQTSMYADVMHLIGWQVEGTPGSQIFYRSLGPLTVAKIQRPMTIDLPRVQSFRKVHHVFTTYIEPGLAMELPSTKLGFSVEPFAHSSTSLIDLSPSESDILKSFTQKTRYNITRNLKKNDLKFTTISFGKLTKLQKSAFFKLHDDWSRKKDVIGYPTSLITAVFKGFSDTGDLHLCYHEQALVGALLTLYSEHVATYYAAFASPLGYKTFAPTLLTWTAMQTARAKGCDIFDFGGIYDPRYPKMYKKWMGFTKFKSGFNPIVLSYPPTTLQLFW